MKIRMRFAKNGMMIYIGHLDVMRYFQKALRRAKTDLVFTKGFSPHPVLSFAAPLGLGIESTGEYADLEVYRTGSTEEMLRRLNAVMVPGMEVLDWRLLPDDAPNAMSCVAAADYMLNFREGFAPENADAWLAGLSAFLNRETIPAEKETKKGTKEVDIRPMILDFALRQAEDGTGPVMFFRVSTGSAGNLKPELILSAYHRELGLPFDVNQIRICRLETYMRKQIGETECLTPLGDAGEVILQDLEDLPEEEPQNAGTE